MDWTVVNAVLILIASIVVLAVIAIVVRRYAASRGSAHGLPIRIIARQPIAPKASVVIVDIGDKRLLLGVTEQSVTLLGSGTLLPPHKQQRSETSDQPGRPLRTAPPATAELSFRAYLSSLFQRSAKGQQ